MTSTQTPTFGDVLRAAIRQELGPDDPRVEAIANAAIEVVADHAFRVLGREYANVGLTIHQLVDGEDEERDFLLGQIEGITSCGRALGVVPPATAASTQPGGCSA